jgi:hypothetical protein
MQRNVHERHPTPAKLPTAAGGKEVGNGSITQKVRDSTPTVMCPLCGREVNRNDLPESIDDDGLALLHERVHTGELIPMLQLAELASRHLDPSTMGIELEFKDYLTKLSNAATTVLEKQVEFLQSATRGEKEEKKAMLEAAMKEQKDLIKEYEGYAKELQEKQLAQMESFNAAISDIREKLVGTAIGRVAEVLTIKELKSAFPQDTFSNSKATKGMADIVATVLENGTHPGRVVISVKNETKWSNEFLDRLRETWTKKGRGGGSWLRCPSPRTHSTTR